MLRTLSRALDRVEATAMVAGLVLATGLIGTQVVLRYGFNESITWAEELTRYAVVWMAFIGAGMGVRRNAHIRVEVVQAMLGPRAARRLSFIAAVAGAAFAVALGVYGAKLVGHTFSTGQRSSALQAPMWIVYSILPLAGATLFFRFVERLAPAAAPAGEASATADIAWKGGL